MFDILNFISIFVNNFLIRNVSSKIFAIQDDDFDAAFKKKKKLITFPRDYKNYFTFQRLHRRQTFRKKMYHFRKKKEKKIETMRVGTKGSRGGENDN